MDVRVAHVHCGSDFSLLDADEVPLLVEADADLLQLKRGNLLLEREKLNLEIQILRAKMDKLSRGNV